MERAGRCRTDCSGAGDYRHGRARCREDPRQHFARTLVALVGVPEVIDTSTLRIEGNLIRLFGVEWARSGQSDLMRYLRGGAILPPNGCGRRLSL